MEAQPLLAGESREELQLVVRQLESKIRELNKRNEEQKAEYEEDVDRLVAECNEKSLRAATLMGLNTLLKSQLSEMQERLAIMNSALAECRRKMEQDLIEKEDENKCSCNETSSISASNFSQVFEETMQLQKGIQTTKQETIKDLEALNHELIAVNGKLHQYVQQDTSVSEVQEAAYKEKEIQLEDEISVLRNTICTMQAKHEVTVQEFSNEISRLKEELDETIQSNAKQFNYVATHNKELKISNTKLSQEIMQQQLSFEAETTKLKQAISSVIALLIEEVPISKLKEESTITGNEQEISFDDDAANLATRVVLITKEWIRSHNIQKLNEEKRASDGSGLAGTLMKKTIESLQEKIENLQEANTSIEVQIAEIDDQKSATEKKLIVSESSVRRHQEEMKKLHTMKEQIERKLRDVEMEASTYRQMENERESELRKKALVVKNLEQQLQSSQEEIIILQKSVSKLNAEKVECMNCMAELKLKMKSDEVEKEAVHQEMSSVQELNKSLLVSIVELQRTNSILEVEKKSLAESLSKVSDTKVILDLENAELTKQKNVDKDELQQIQSTNKHLSSKIEELDRNLSELELTCMKLKSEKEELSQEAIALSEALTKLRRALSEVQIQRGKLSQSIAKVAQEKGELIQTKLQLNSEISRLQATLNHVNEKLNEVTVANVQLESKKNCADRKVAEAQTEIENLTQSNLSFQKQKQQLLESHSKAMESKEEIIAQFQSRHVQELEKIINEANIKEAELRRSLNSKEVEFSKELSNTKKIFEAKLASKEQEILNISEKMESEIAVLKENCDSEVAKLKSEREVYVTNLEKSHEIKVKSSESQKQLLERKLQALEVAKKDAESTIIKMKAELNVSETTIDELGKQLNSNEQELKALQETIDQIKTHAQKHLDNMQNDLLEANSSIKKLEHKYENARASNVRLQESRDYYHDLLAEAQSSIDQLQQDKDSLTAAKRRLEKDLEEKVASFESQKYNTAELKELKLKAEVERDTLVAECGKIRQSLLLAEESLTKLSLEHQAIQKSMAQHQKEANDLRVQLTACKVEKDSLNLRLEESEKMAEQLKESMLMITVAHDSKDNELENMREILHSVKEEKEKLQVSFAQLEEISLIQVQESSSAIAELKKSIQELKDKRNESIKAINSKEIELKQEKDKANDLQSEFEAVKREKMARDTELVKIVKTHQDTCAEYSKLADVLTGCFTEIKLQPTTDPSTLAAPQQESSGSSHDSMQAICSDIASSSMDDSALGFEHTSSFVFLPLDTSIVHHAIQSLQLESMKLRNSNFRLEEENASLKNSTTHLKMSQRSLENELSKLKASQESLQSSHTFLVKNKETMEQIITHSNEEILQMKKNIATLQSESEKMKKDLENSSLDVKAQSTHVSTLTQELLEHEVARSKALGRLKQTQSILSAREKENSELKKNIDALMAEMRGKESEAYELTKTINTLQVSLEKSKREFEVAQREVKELMKSMEASSKANCKLKMELQNETRRNKEIEKDCQHLSTKVTSLENELKLSNEKECALLKEISLIRERKVTEEQRATSFMIALQLTRIHKKMNSLEKQITEYESSASLLKTTIANLTSEKILLEEQLTMSKDRENALKIQIEGIKSESQLMKAMNDEVYQRLQCENETLVNSLNEAKDKLLQLEDELKTALEHGQMVQDIRAQHSQQTKQLATLIKKNSDMLSRIRELEGMAVQQDKKHAQELQAHSQEVKLAQAEIEFLRKMWSAEETGLKESIEEQERKILMLEDQLRHARDKKLKQESSNYYSNDVIVIEDQNKKVNNSSGGGTKGRFDSTGNDDHYEVISIN